MPAGVNYLPVDTAQNLGRFQYSVLTSVSVARSMKFVKIISKNEQWADNTKRPCCCIRGNFH